MVKNEDDTCVVVIGQISKCMYKFDNFPGLKKLKMTGVLTLHFQCCN